MNKYLINLLKKKKEVSLKSTVLSIFSLVTIILIIVLGSQLFYFSKKLSLESIDLQLNGLVQDIRTSIKSNETLNFNMIEMLSLMKDKNNFELYINILATHPSLYAIYTGYEDGSFYEIINLNSNKSLPQIYNAESTDKWLLIKISGQDINKREIYLYNSDLKLTSSRISDNNYNPTTRPWYKMAISSNSSIKTPPYKFSHIDSTGITYAKQISNSKNIIAIDVLINDFRSIYKNHINSDYIDVYLFKKDNTIISSLSDNTNLFKEFFKENIIITDFTKPKIIKLNKKQYVVQIVPLNEQNNEENIILLAEYDKIIEPYQVQILNLLLTFIITVLLMIPIIIYFSGIIVKPIYELVKQSIKVKKRKYNTITKVETSILEVALLSSSLESMSESIYNYQHSLEEKVKQRTKELSLKNEELLKLSITDKLTSLYNREKLDKTLQYEMNRSLRYGVVFSVIIIDIDFFKKVNDEFGHQVGDEVLVESANILRNSIRNVDVLGRWGGEEFLIVCPQTDLEGAQKLAKNINNAIKNHIFSTYPKTITMSLGVASYNENIFKAEEIVSNADKALYKAKENGRDQVVIFR